MVHEDIFIKVSQVFFDVFRVAKTSPLALLKSTSDKKSTTVGSREPDHSTSIIAGKWRNHELSFLCQRKRTQEVVHSFQMKTDTYSKMYINTA